MPERPPITGTGVVRAERVVDRLYEVEMPNGFRVFGVVPKDGPVCPEDAEPVGASVSAAFSPYDLSRCRITGWLTG
jgi:hypothetical protein